MLAFGATPGRISQTFNFSMVNLPCSVQYLAHIRAARDKNAGATIYSLKSQSLAAYNSLIQEPMC